MKKKSYALVGSWDWDGCEASKKGINYCQYDTDSGHIECIRNYLPDIKIGSEACVVGNKVYFVEEIKQTRMRKSGGGGYTYFAEIIEDGLEIKEQRNTLACNPCYCAIDKTNRYLLISHYGSSRDTATKLVRNKDGTITHHIIYDDAALVLFRLKENGNYDKIVDYDAHEPMDGVCSLLHSVYYDETSSIFFVFDKGLDNMYSYRIDYENESLVLLDTLHFSEKCDPRYCVIHPSLHKIYSTNEKMPVLYTVGYDAQSGKLSKEAETNLLMQEVGEDDVAMSSDIKITPDYQHVYVAIRGVDQIAVCDIDNRGIVTLKENVDGNGKFPRGLGMNKNGTYLFICNTESDNITSFSIQKNGSLVKKDVFSISRPANITIVEEE